MATENLIPGQENTETGTESDILTQDTDTGANPPGNPPEETPPAAEPKQGEGEPASLAAPYEKFALPEGMEYAEERAQAFGGLAKELGLTQEQAQRLVNFEVQEIQAAVQGQRDSHDRRASEWTNAAKADREFGGERLEENLGIARAALDALASSELRDYLEKEGLGNHPELIRFCWKVGKLLGEDKVPGAADGRRGAGIARTAEEFADSFYGKK